MKKNSEMTFHEAWQFLNEHPRLNPEDCHINFISSLAIDVVKVNPKTESIDMYNPKRNTDTRVWLECGAPHKMTKSECKIFNEDYGSYTAWIGSHDIDLDCGGKTFEEAIIQLAKLVKRKYRKR